MPYRLESTETVSQGIRRVASEELAAALVELRGQSDRASEDQIHEARKSLKKLRGLLRLSRGTLERATYVEQDACFRNAGRLLSGSREGVAILECFEALLLEPTVHDDASEFGPARRWLLHHRRPSTREEAAGRSAAVEALEAAYERVASWQSADDGWKPLAKGLAANYARGRKGFARAYHRPSFNAFHDWRKRTKYLGYHIRLLEPSWPGPMAALRSEVSELSELLGDDHDLADLLAALPAPESDEGRQLLVPRLGELARLRSLALREQAYPIARRVYAEGARSFSRRVGRYFASWERAGAAGAPRRR